MTTSRLSNRFKKSKQYGMEDMVRDLIDQGQELETILGALQNTVTSLQGQINTINARLLAAGIP